MNVEIDTTRIFKGQSLTGLIFSRWTVLGYAGACVREYGCAHYWKCQCICGIVRSVLASSLTSGKSKSCGCWSEERKTTHGLAKHNGQKHKVYESWGSMIQRCTNPNATHYHRYGGRGIMVCERWMEFENFRQDMFDSYHPGLTLERKDVNGNYEPLNCCWVTRKEQSMNTSRQAKVEYNGEIKHLIEWSKCLGICIRTLRQRYHKGFKGDKLFKLPIYKKVNRK